MKTEPTNDVNEPNSEHVRTPTKDTEIEAVAEENGIDESHARRIDNGSVVRNKRLGGRSPKLIRRFGKLLINKGLFSRHDCDCDLFVTANLDNVTT